MRAERRPWELFLLGFLYTSIAMFISIQIFEQSAGLIAVFLTVMACIPLIYATIKYEEQKDLLPMPEIRLLKEHGKALSCFILLFLGMVFAFSLWFLFLPPESAQVIFSPQLMTINTINQISGQVSAPAILGRILANNLKVLTLCVLFSFFYGAGAIFILGWNASVISVAIGTLVRNKLADSAAAFGMQQVSAYFHVFTISFLRYLFHGIPEIFGYVIGGLAGGILSVAVIKKELLTNKFGRILLDAGNLLIIAVGFLILAALLEVYITPALF